MLPSRLLEVRWQPWAISVSKTTPFSGNKTLTVALSSPSGGATIISPGNASVTITGSAVAAVGHLGQQDDPLLRQQNSDGGSVQPERGRDYHQSGQCFRHDYWKCGGSRGPSRSARRPPSQATKL